MDVDAVMDCEPTRLMLATKREEAGAFDALVQAMRNRAYHVAYSLVGSREDALDMAQEALMKTYRARDTFREGEPFLPWFHRILRNTCYTFLRKSRRLKKVSLSAKEDDESDWEIAGDEPRPDAVLETHDTKLLFWKALESLSARDREILVLRHFQDLSYKEIAEAMDCPVGTVMSRLFHARRRLREKLSPHLEPAGSA